MEDNWDWIDKWNLIDGMYYGQMDTQCEFPVCEIHTNPTKYNFRCKNPKCIYKKIIKPKKSKKFCFITLQDFKTRVEDIEKLKLFLKRIAYMYEEGYWVIESGSSINVHLHMLVKIKDSCKNHKAVLNAKWESLFLRSIATNDYYKLQQHRDCDSMPSYEDWCEEKINYFDNLKKGSHKNVVDLDQCGTFHDPEGSGGFLLPLL